MFGMSDWLRQHSPARKGPRATRDKQEVARCVKGSQKEPFTVMLMAVTQDQVQVVLHQFHQVGQQMVHQVQVRYQE